MRRSKKAPSSDLTASNSQNIPISLGKPSLRIRLEAYYSLIDPSKLNDTTKWRSQYDEIYKKYGASYEGERKLASKLAKKYGTRVKLLLAESHEKKSPISTTGQTNTPSETFKVFDESFYKISEVGSGDFSFCSDKFDPVAALKASEDQVEKANPWFKQVKIPILDNTLQFARFLPVGDPLRQTRATTKRQPSSSVDTSSKKHQRQSHIFDKIAESFSERGPFSVLHKLRGQRICIVVRYVNAIRGTVTGILVAFDKHMNMILRDVEEVYSPRPRERHSMSNVEVELERRKKLKLEESSNQNDGSGAWSVKRRRMKQIMLRGDNVVSAYGAEQKTLKQS